MESIKQIIGNKDFFKKKDIERQSWQILALDIIKALKDGYKFKGSIFKCCKKNERACKFALNDCKELDKMMSLYFLKVFNLLDKK